MFRRLFSIFIILMASGVQAQDFREQFNGFFQNKDTVGQQKVLGEWQAKRKDDPELYVARFNYYFSNARRELLHLGNNPEGKEAFALQDSTGNTVSYLYQGDTGYDPKKLGLAMKTINEAISKFPKRLDMRFGKTYALGELRDWKNFTDEITATIDYSAKIKNQWLWRDGKPVDDPKNFMLGSIQGYFNQLYETGDDALLASMRRISETVLKYYPDDVMNLSNLAILKLLDKDFDGALTLLLKAEKLAPDDTVVQNNIAMCYSEKGQYDKAIAYYEKMLPKSDEESKVRIQKRIEALKAKR